MKTEDEFFRKAVSLKVWKRARIYVTLDCGHKITLVYDRASAPFHAVGKAYKCHTCARFGHSAKEF